MIQNNLETVTRKKKILLFGVGWLGKELVQSLLAQKHDLYIATRDVNKWIAYKAKLKLIRVDLYSLVLNYDSGSFDLVIIMLPPSGFSSYEQIIKNICGKIPEAKHVVFTSSTGVYENQNESVNEESKVDEKHVVFHAEQQIVKSFPGKYTILRLSGLISEDRHPTKYLLKKEQNLGGDVPVNLIHRTDVIRAINCLKESEPSSEIYNLSYPENPSRSDYYNFFAKKFYGRLIHFSGGGNGKTIIGSKFVKKYGYQYKMSIWDVQLNNI